MINKFMEKSASLGETMPESQSEIPLTIVSMVTATPGKEQQLREAILATAKSSRRDPGNIDFNVHVAKDSAAKFVIIEHWVDEAALAKHKKGQVLTNFYRFAHENELFQGTPNEQHLRAITPPE